MTRAVLITECLQNDFVKPLAEGESLPYNKTWALYNSCRLAERIMTALGSDGGQ
jgi:hypothetical protein